MKNLFTLVLSLAVILNSVELSSQSESWSNIGHTLDVPRTETSDSPRTPHPTRYRSRSPLARNFSLGGSSSSNPPSSSRRIIPPNRLPSNDGPGYSLDQLPLIRLIRRTNSHRIFELRKYTFPMNTGMTLRFPQQNFEPVPLPTQEQIVMSTSHGEVFAILETENTLAGMYITERKKGRRVKINMYSRRVTLLSPEEIRDSPVGSARGIRKCFEMIRIKHL